MSARPARQLKAPTGAMLPATIVLSIVLCGAAWSFLVMREDEARAKAAAEANALEEEIAKAQAYMKGRPDDVQSQELANETAQLLQRRVPFDRKDLAVVQYFQLRAADAGIPDFKYDILNGMKLPNEGEKEKSADERLRFEPSKLQGQQITMDFTSRFAEFLKFQRAIAEAPWLIDVTQVDLKRDKDNTVKAHVTVRYMYQ